MFSVPGIRQLPGHPGSARLRDMGSDLPDVSEILDRAIWKFSFKLDKGKFDWRYEFRQVPGFKLDPRIVQKSGDLLKLPPQSGDERMEKKVVADEATMQGIGAVSGEFYVYDRDKEVLRRSTNVQLLTGYLDETGGVRVYRDGIRVYNYEPPREFRRPVSLYMDSSIHATIHVLE